ncbi:hypothetical protein SH668x_002964 [Planctomicrobium sp. SH668]|uniref:hypothetical protein n=1 Tax=Planctomicrobium sp. SH668 TaxID=3448126 RepID=UPI003F5C19BE
MSDVEIANREYMILEKEIKEDRNDPRQAVLVSAGSIKDLKKAYPNFFLDVDSFLDRVKKIINE